MTSHRGTPGLFGLGALVALFTISAPWTTALAWDDYDLYPSSACDGNQQNLGWGSANQGMLGFLNGDYGHAYCPIVHNGVTKKPATLYSVAVTCYHDSQEPDDLEAGETTIPDRTVAPT